MSRRVAVIGLDCADPNARLRPLARRPAEHPWARRARNVGPAAERRSAHHRARLELHAHRPRPGRARDLRVPQPARTTRTTRSASPTRARSTSIASGITSAARGKHVIALGVPQTSPPVPVNGELVSCFLTPDPQKSEFTLPAGPARRDRGLVGAVPHRRAQLPQRRPRPHPGRDLRDDRAALRGRAAPARHAAVGLLHDGRDRRRPHPPRVLALARPRASAVRAGSSLRRRDPELLPVPRRRDRRAARRFDDDTAVLVVSDHGAQAMEGAICINEWLVQEGYLVLREPAAPRSRRSASWTSTGAGRGRGARAATTAGSSSTWRVASRRASCRHRSTTPCGTS